MGIIADTFRRQLIEMQTRHETTQKEIEEDLAKCWIAFNKLQQAQHELEAELERS